VDLIDREDDDSVEYSLQSTWYFNPKKSNGLTGEEEMVFPHLMILGMVGATLRERPAAIGVIGTHVRFMRGLMLPFSFNVAYRLHSRFGIHIAPLPAITHAGVFKVEHEICSVFST